MEQIIKTSQEFFNFLAYLKYIEGKKQSVLFGTEDKDSGFKKPKFFAKYIVSDDEKDFNTLEDIAKYPYYPTLKQKMIKAVKLYHIYRSNAEINLPIYSDIVWDMDKYYKKEGGIITFSSKMFSKVLQNVSEHSDITVEITKVSNNYIRKIDLLKQKFLFSKSTLISSLKMFLSTFIFKKLSETHNILINDSNGNYISIKACFWLINKKYPIISFFEKSIDDFNGDIVQNKILDSIQRVNKNGNPMNDKFGNMHTILENLPLIDVVDDYLSIDQENELYRDSLIELLFSISDDKIPKKEKIKIKNSLKKVKLRKNNKEIIKVLELLKKHLISL